VLPLAHRRGGRLDGRHPLPIQAQLGGGIGGRGGRRVHHGLARGDGASLEVDGSMTTTAQRPRAVSLPISFADVAAARERIAGYLPPTPLRNYPQLDEVVGHGVEIVVKHENHQPTNSFKIRNGLSFMTALTAAERKRGVVAASTGNHGQGIAFGGRALDVSTTICVPAGNNPEKNAA